MEHIWWLSSWASGLRGQDGGMRLRKIREVIADRRRYLEILA